MSSYNDERIAFWRHQRAFREIAVQEMRRRMPEDVETVVLSIDDTPRLTVSDLLAENGTSLLEEYDGSMAYEVLYDIALDMEAFTWDEAASFLDTDGGRLSVSRVTA